MIRHSLIAAVLAGAAIAPAFAQPGAAPGATAQMREFKCPQLPDPVDFSARPAGWQVVLANPDATFRGWNIGSADPVIRDGKPQIVLSCVQLEAGRTEFWIRRIIDANTVCRFDADTMTHFCR